MGCRIKLPFEERVGLLKFVEKAAAAGKSQERTALRKRFQKNVLVGLVHVEDGDVLKDLGF